uniref:Uncharacterized protein n=1 Tax=Anguilla anguilla TaxID=7936 RepID=A0A0E9VYY1_ANGAN
MAVPWQPRGGLDFLVGKTPWLAELHMTKD